MKLKKHISALVLSAIFLGILFLSACSSGPNTPAEKATATAYTQLQDYYAGCTKIGKSMPLPGDQKKIHAVLCGFRTQKQPNLPTLVKLFSDGDPSKQVEGSTEDEPKSVPGQKAVKITEYSPPNWYCVRVDPEIGVTSVTNINPNDTCK